MYNLAAIHTHRPSQLALFILFGLLVTACGSGGSSGGDGDSSSGSSGSATSSSGMPLRTSHRAGEDCKTCHTSGGSAEAEGIFYASGTVYTSNGAPQTNATVRLYVHNTNTIAALIETDDSGNFYHLDPIQGLSTGDGQLVEGVDVEVDTPNGTRSMPGLVTNGGCNGCHHTGNGGNGRIVAN